MPHPIIIATCAQHGISVESFLGYGRSERLMVCRAVAVRSLRHSGYSWKSISRLVGRTIQTIEIWNCPASRAKLNAYKRERWHEIYKKQVTA